MDDPRRIYALTLWQPWATLMATGAKRIETRSWPCPAGLIGKPLAIHAAKNFRKEDQQLCMSDPFFQPLYQDVGGPGYQVPDKLPLGAVVAVVRVTACEPTAKIRRIARSAPMPEQERAFGDYTDGRYGWFTELLRRFEEPIPARGAQGLWKWTVPAGALDGVTL